MILVKDIRKNFGKLWALDGVNLEFNKGKAYALIGPNGSGKTTLIKSILGLVIPASGEILVDGETTLRHWKYREKIGYMPQIGRYPDNMKIGQIFDMVKNIRQSEQALDEELATLFGLNKMLEKRMHTLSGGTRQKVSAALAFLFNPPILILDEPTAGLDPLAVEHLKEKVQREKEAGKLLIITSHIMSDLDDLTTELTYMLDGQLVYNNSIAQVKQETGQDRLGKAISQLILQGTFQSKAEKV